MDVIEVLKAKTEGMPDEVVITLTTQQGRALLSQLEAERQRADTAEAERNTALKQASAARNGFDEQYQLREKAEGSVADLEKRLRCTEEALIAATDLHSTALKGDQAPVAVLYKTGDVLTREECADDKVFAICCKVETPLFTAPQKPTPEQLIEWLEGMDVSVDVSTCDADHGNRLFGKVTEVSELDGAKNGVILLVQEPAANFTAPQKPVVLPKIRDSKYWGGVEFRCDKYQLDVQAAIEAAGGIVKDGE